MFWTEKELHYLQKVYSTKIPLKIISKNLKKSTKAIKHKAARMMLSRQDIPYNKPKNKNHRNEYDKLYYSKYRERIYLNKKERIRERKRQLIGLLGGKCQTCGYNMCPTALDFHHKDSRKENSVSALLHKVSKEKILKEVKKCILLCANCHRELHYNKGT